MGQKLKTKNGPAIWQLEEVIIGSHLPLGVRVRIETAPNSGVFEYVDFSTKEYLCHVKDTPNSDVTPDAVFTCTPRGNGVGDIGWVDLYMDGVETAKLLPDREYQASLKIWPIGQPADGDTFLVIIMPVKFRATR